MKAVLYTTYPIHAYIQTLFPHKTNIHEHTDTKNHGLPKRRDWFLFDVDCGPDNEVQLGAALFQKDLHFAV